MISIPFEHINLNESNKNRGKYNCTNMVRSTCPRLFRGNIGRFLRGNPLDSKRLTNTCEVELSDGIRKDPFIMFLHICHDRCTVGNAYGSYTMCMSRRIPAARARRTRVESFAMGGILYIFVIYSHRGHFVSRYSRQIDHAESLLLQVKGPTAMSDIREVSLTVMLKLLQI